MSKQEMKDLHQRCREIVKDLDIKVITPMAPPMSARPPKVQEGPIIIDYLSILV